MTASRIAILTDSCTDTPTYLAESHPVYTVAMHVNYRDRSYLDRIDITPEDVYARLPEEVPTTSTPSVKEVTDTFARIVADGFTHVICVDISSALSGTLNLVEQVSRNFSELTTKVVDTFNIGFGAGFTVKYVCELLDQKLHFDEIVAKAKAIVPKTHTYFVVDTLDYLFKGGRIGKATYALGSVLNIKPVITCDEEGKYVVATKGRGRKGSIKKVKELITKATQGKPFNLAIANGNAIQEADELVAAARSEFAQVRDIIDAGQISPVLTVHTGPGLLGLAVQPVQ